MLITLDIPSADRPLLERFAQEHGYPVFAQEDTLDVPDWQIELNRARRAAAKPDDYQDWEEMRLDFGLNG